MIVRYKDSQKDEPSLTVSEIFQKYMLKNTEPFLFYCRVPPYTRYTVRQTLS
jgi:hypothetical protein